MPKRLSPVLLLSVLVTLVASVGATAESAPGVEVIIETTMGSFELELDPEQAPQTVANFLTYVDQGFYSDTLIHRVIPGFVIQGGGYGAGMQLRQTLPPVQNESDNGLTNARGTISMARPRNPDAATSQFFINVANNAKLDARPNQPGYAVFGRVTRGMEIVDAIVAVPTASRDRFKDVPEKDVFVRSARRKLGADESDTAAGRFSPGRDYVVLDEPVPTRDASKIEVVEAFSYGCANCYQMEPLIDAWRSRQQGDVDFRRFHAVWNPAMKLYARAFYAAKHIDAAEKIHLRLFSAIVVDHEQLGDAPALARFIGEQGVDEAAFSEAFASPAVAKQVEQSEARSRDYNLASVPEIVVNGKYRVDPMRAGGRARMLAVVDYLVDEERSLQSE